MLLVAVGLAQVRAFRRLSELGHEMIFDQGSIPLARYRVVHMQRQWRERACRHLGAQTRKALSIRLHRPPSCTRLPSYTSVILQIVSAGSGGAGRNHQRKPPTLVPTCL